MLNPPNSLSLLRAPLAFLFLSENTTLRNLSVLVALISDCVDGYLARKYKYTSKLGAVLDPLMDKFFVFFVLAVFIMEGKLLVWQSVLMISRDLFLCIFAIYLLINQSWQRFEIRSVRWGKITTGLQFSIIFMLINHYTPFQQVYWAFLMMGFFVFLELIKADISYTKNLDDTL
jgi:CDP-diacylglycerol--glycerol-3-phosphate 3-phosphatidyltransferase